MDTIKYFNEKKRMLNSLGRISGRCNLVNCEDCPLSSFNAKHKLSCSAFELEYPEEAAAIIKKWAEEHPQKTILMDFLEKYPKARLDKGIPIICAKHLGYIKECDSYCTECWNRPLEW